MRITHFCAVCRKPLSDDVWPYAACKACGSKNCKHGNKPAECNDCAVEADFAYDAGRENRARF